jgi:hypothetical protein
VTEVMCADTLAHADAGAQLSKHAVDTRGAVACPVCGAPMERSVAGQTRVELDTCRSHGTWFDRDELGRVAQAHATARAYGQHGSAALVGGAAVGGAAVVGAAAVGAAVAADQGFFARQFQHVDAADAAEIAIEGGSAAFDVGGAIGDAADAAGGGAEIAGTVFELLGGLFEGLG